MGLEEDVSFFGVPDVGLRWIEFDYEMEGVATAPGMIQRGLIIRNSRVGGEEGDWLPPCRDSDDFGCILSDIMNLECLMYPIVCTNEFALGRFQTTTMKYFRPFASDMEICEERFFILWERDDPMIYFSSLLTDGLVIVTSRSFSKIFSGFNGPFVSFRRGNVHKKLSFTHSINTEFDCMFCSMRKRQCECSFNLEPLTPMQSKSSEVWKDLGQNPKRRIPSSVRWQQLCDALSRSTPFSYGASFQIYGSDGRNGGQFRKVASEHAYILLNCSGEYNVSEPLVYRHVHSLIVRSTNPSNSLRTYASQCRRSSSAPLTIEAPQKQWVSRTDDRKKKEEGVFFIPPIPARFRIHLFLMGFQL